MKPHGLLLQAGFLLFSLFAGGLLSGLLGQSVIPVYMLIGLAAQGVLPESDLMAPAADLGLILLLFFIGLEFSFRSFLYNWKRTLASGGVDFLVNFPAGFLMGILLGFGWVGSLFLGAIVYPSSSAIITKNMVDSRFSAMPESEPILRVLVFEDIFIAVLLGLLAGLAKDGDGGLMAPLLSAGKALVFFVAADFIVRRNVRAVNRMLSVESSELFLLACLGFVLVVSGAAAMLGLTEAVGAFVAGMLLSETDRRERIEEKLGPFKDLFAAVFFLNFGMSMDYAGVVPALLPALALTAVCFASKLAGGYVIGRTEMLSERGSLGVGVGLLPRGEFSVIIAGLAAGMAEASRLYSLAAVFVLISATLGVVAMREYPRVYFWNLARRGRLRKDAGEGT